MIEIFQANFASDNKEILIEIDKSLPEGEGDEWREEVERLCERDAETLFWLFYKNLPIATCQHLAFKLAGIEAKIIDRVIRESEEREQ